MVIDCDCMSEHNFSKLLLPQPQTQLVAHSTSPTKKLQGSEKMVSVSVIYLLQSVVQMVDIREDDLNYPFPL